MGLRMTMSVLPIVGLFVALIWFKFKYKLTEEKVAEIAQQVHEKHMKEEA